MVLTGIAIRARVALALTCIQNAIDQNGVRDDRITELTEVLWRSLEEHLNLDEASRETGLSDFLFEFVEDGAPESYRGLPGFLLQMLYDTLRIGTADYYGAVVSFSEESFDFTVNVLELCEKNRVQIPSLGKFAQLPFSRADYWPRDHGYGPVVPRSYFESHHKPGSLEQYLKELYRGMEEGTGWSGAELEELVSRYDFTMANGSS